MTSSNSFPFSDLPRAESQRPMVWEANIIRNRWTFFSSSILSLRLVRRGDLSDDDVRSRSPIERCSRESTLWLAKCNRNRSWSRICLVWNAEKRKKRSFTSLSDMFVFRRQLKRFVNKIPHRTLIAERIPQYQERSALLPGGVNTPFPIVVVPDVDLELLFKSHERLKENLQRRHWIVDVKKVEADYRIWKKARRELGRSFSTTRFGLIVLTFFDFTLTPSSLSARTSSTVGRTIPRAQREVSRRLPSTAGAAARVGSRNEFVEVSLRIRNATQIEFDDAIVARFSRSDVVGRRAVLVLRVRRIVSRTKIRLGKTFFFSFCSAQLEYLLLNFFNKSLDTYQMQFCSTVNVVQSFVIEAFGYHFSDIKNVFNIVGEFTSDEFFSSIDVRGSSLVETDDEENSGELLHLFGASTPLGIVSPFIRTNFPKEALPFYIYSIGRNYTPHQGQSSCIELLGRVTRNFLGESLTSFPVFQPFPTNLRSICWSTISTKSPMNKRNISTTCWKKHWRLRQRSARKRSTWPRTRSITFSFSWLRSSPVSTISWTSLCASVSRRPTNFSLTNRCVWTSKFIFRRSWIMFASVRFRWSTIIWRDDWWSNTVLTSEATSRWFTRVSPMFLNCPNAF